MGVIQTSLGQSPPCDQAGDASHADLWTVESTPHKEGQWESRGWRGDEWERVWMRGDHHWLTNGVFESAYFCDYWLDSFKVDQSHDKNSKQVLTDISFPMFMLMTHLYMVGWLCSQAWNKLQWSHHQYFHYIALIAVFIITVSPILISPPTANQRLMAHAAVCWVTIISLALTAHIKRVTFVDEPEIQASQGFLQSHSCIMTAHSHVGKQPWHTDTQRHEHKHIYA